MHRWRDPRFRLAVLAVVALGSAGLALLVDAAGLLRRAEQVTVDARFEVRGERPHATKIAVVGMDDKTFGDLQERPPLPRSIHGEVITRLHDAGARVIAYDVQFTEPTEVDEDNALIDAIDGAESVVLSTTEVDRGATGVLGGDDVVASIGARAASTVLPVDGGGAIRRFGLEQDGLPSFPVVTADTALGRRVTVPRDDPTPYIAFAGPARTIRTLSLSDVHAGRFDASIVRDAVVVVGAVAPSLQDVHATPFGLMAGPEIQANAAATALAGFPLQAAPGWLGALLALGLAAAAPLAVLRARPLVTVLCVAGAGALFLVAAQVSFGAGTVLPVAVPVLALLVSGVATLGVEALRSAFERERVRSSFARFVPESVVGEVLATTEGGRLGGVRRDATSMFSDLRGFTTFSEHREPDEMIDVLNRYLTQMTEAILAHGGTLVAFMGDGIFAVFGAPLEQDDHADRALAAAREMVGPRLATVNTWLAEHGYDAEFRMGVGLNSGPVMSGNVGSERRMEYAAIGDTTNAAARLEALTKETGHTVLIAAATRERLHAPADDLELVGRYALRGRSAECEVWGLGGAARAAEPAEAPAA